MRLEGSVIDAIHALRAMPDALAEWLPPYHPDAAAGSPLANELAQAPEFNDIILETASRGRVAALICADAAVGLSRELLPNWEAPLSTVGIARTAIDVAGAALWLLQPGLTATGRIARYLALSENEVAESQGFLSRAISEAPHLREHLIARGGAELRRVDTKHADLSSIKPAKMPNRRDFAALVTSASEYLGYSSAVHGSVAGYNEVKGMWSSPEHMPWLLANVLFATARANSLAVVQLIEHVRGPRPEHLDRRLRAISKRMGFADDDLLPPYPRELHPLPSAYPE